MKIAIKDCQKKIPINPKKIQKAIRKILLSEGIKKSGEITVCFVNDLQIKRLNLKYLHKNQPTDVISFDLSTDKREISADIAVSTETACRNARIFQTAPLYELYLYLIHGLLHLLGYNDLTARQRDIMQNKQETLLNTILRKQYPILKNAHP